MLVSRFSVKSFGRPDLWGLEIGARFDAGWNHDVGAKGRCHGREGNEGCGGSGAWIEVPADDVGDAIVAALTAGEIDHHFFTSGSEIAFFQEATAKARARKTTSCRA